MAGEVVVKKVELRLVNGEELIRGVFNIEVTGLSFVFDAYYYSDEMGSVQFMAWTGDKLWENYENEIIELLNGFIVLDNE